MVSLSCYFVGLHGLSFRRMKQQMTAINVYYIQLHKEMSSVCKTSKNRLVLDNPAVAHECVLKKKRTV